MTRQFVAGYEQSLKSRQKAKGGLVLGSLGIDFTKWLPNATNEGEAQVGDAKTIKITGQADVKQVIADLEKITEKASALNVPGASGRLPQKLTPEQKAAAEAAIKGLTVDGLHRRRRLDPAPAGRQRRPPGRRLEDRRGRAAGPHVHEGGSGADDHRPL